MAAPAPTNNAAFARRVTMLLQVRRRQRLKRLLAAQVCTLQAVAHAAARVWQLCDAHRAVAARGASQRVSLAVCVCVCVPGAVVNSK